MSRRKQTSRSTSHTNVRFAQAVSVPLLLLTTAAVALSSTADDELKLVLEGEVRYRRK